MLRAACLALVLIGLTGCGSLIPQRPETPEKPNPKTLLKRAEAKRSNGKLAEARELLVDAKRKYPEHQGIHRALDRTNKELLRVRESLNDRLLVVRAESLRQELPILEDLKEADPNDRMSKANVDQARSELEHRAGALSACGKRQQKIHPGLASRCLKIALAIRDDPADQQLLQEITERGKIEEKKRDELQKEQQKIIQSQTNLEQARGLMKKGDYFHALKILDQLLSRHPDLVEAQELLFQIQTFLEEYSMTLVATGDTLYREGRVESAITSWEAALKLNPDNEQAAQKLERAQRVLGNLEQLRKEQQQTTDPGEKNTPNGAK